MALFEIKNLNFTYPNQKRMILKDISFEIDEGDFITICGKSGCGKSTLIRHFKPGLLPYGKQEGTILYKNKNINDIEDREVCQSIGFVTQRPDNQIVTDKVWHEMAFGLENLGMDLQSMRIKVAEMSHYFGIQNWFHKDVDQLSGGQKQILNLASVMVMNPDILILDEPTSQLDPIAATDFLYTLKKLNTDFGITILLIEHRLEEALPLSNKVMIMEEGSIKLFDSPKHIIKSSQVMDIYDILPTPMRIFLKLQNEGNPPLTINEGRHWFKQYAKKNCLTDYENISDKIDITSQTIMDIENIWFRYDKKSDDIIKGLSIKIYQGNIYCIMGGNGAGKSTFLNVISALYKPYRGNIRLFGKNINKYSRQKLHQVLAVLPQDPQCLFVSDTVEGDLLEVLRDLEIGSNEKQERLKKVIDDTEIQSILKNHPYDLSGGEQQKVALAKILLMNPQIIFLDEPTKGIDGIFKKKLIHIFHKIKHQGKTIVMVSHDVEFCAQIGDICALFFDGQILAEKIAKSFFVDNQFYTTALNRMTRGICNHIVEEEDLISLCEKQ